MAIKEFFMKDFCNRSTDDSSVRVPSLGSAEMVDRYRRKFLLEARRMFKLNHRNIVRVFNVFEENGTAYYVMEYLPGGSLSDRINSSGLSEPLALGCIRQICDSLSYIHSEKILHLDIKPSNILFRKKDEVVLIDFGISKHYDDADGSQTSSTPVGISRGYAPLEQYKSGGVAQFTPATDIYSLGATLFKLLTGLTPPDADEVNEEGLSGIPSSVSASTRAAVEHAMSPRRKDRPQSVEEFIRLLHAPVVSDLDEETKLLGPEDLPTSQVYYKDNVLVVNGIEYPMVYVEGGKFTMGDGIFLASDRRHEVNLNGFRIGKFEVTQDIWEALMMPNPSFKKSPRRPVENVTWDYCQKFIRKLNKLTGSCFRLPTEAEWEYAARGGKFGTNCKYAGSNNLSDVAWYSRNSGGETHDVGQKGPNELDLYDMSGNVFEWCGDWFAPYPKDSQLNPRGPVNGHQRVVRGGGFNRGAEFCLCTFRTPVSPVRNVKNIGFRLCL